MTSVGVESAVNLHDFEALQHVVVRPQVWLRPMQDSDDEALLAMLAEDPVIRTRVSTASRMTDPQAVRQEVADYLADPGLIRYVIVDNDQVAGLVSLWADSDLFPGREPQKDTYGFGYFLAPAHRGKGLVTDSVKALMDATQHSFRVDSFIAFCEPDNAESLTVLEKLGFIATDSSFVEPNNNWQEYLYEKKVVNR